MTARIGIIGLGTMGTHHAERIDGAGGVVAGGADVSATARETFARNFDAPTYADYTELVVADDIDAVIGTVPNALHEEIAVGALDADIPVLIEKPLAHTLNSAERIAEVSHGSDAFCLVGFVLRYYEEVQELLSRAHQGDFGDIHHIEARYMRRDGVPPGGWFVDPALAGGGALVDVGVHVLDLALAVLGFPAIESVYGRTRTERVQLPVEDSASALIRCATGATISLEISWAANCDPGRSLIVRGSDGGAALDISAQELRVITDSTGDPEIVPTATADWLSPEVEAFVDAVESGAPPDAGTIAQAMTVQRVLDAVYRSDESNSLVEP